MNVEKIEHLENLIFKFVKIFFRRAKPMSVRGYVFIFVIYIVYLIIGAVVFSTLEAKEEKNKCAHAMQKIKTAKSDFVNKEISKTLFLMHHYFLQQIIYFKLECTDRVVS